MTRHTLKQFASTMTILALIITSTGKINAQSRLERLRAEYEACGNPSYTFLFPKEKGANLRILDINIWQWDYDRKELPKEWIEAGEDCTNEVRSKGFNSIVSAYMPEIVCLQEYSPLMHEHLYPMLTDSGYEITFIPEKSNFTPIFYRKSHVKLIESDYYSHKQPYNNKNTKSFTTAVFKLKKNGKRFIVINTHLWWKSEKAMEGSDNARTQQMKNIIAVAEQLQKKHDCPVFLMGDLNCTLRSEALGKALNAGYRPAWEIATVYGDLRGGHHQCDKKGFSRKSNKTDDGFGCIDHFLIRDTSGKVEVKTFHRDYAWFTVKLTDHYPNYADIRLK